MPAEDLALFEDDLLTEELPKSLSKLVLFILLIALRHALDAVVIVNELRVFEVRLDVVLESLAVWLILHIAVGPQRVG